MISSSPQSAAARLLMPEFRRNWRSRMMTGINGDLGGAASGTGTDPGSSWDPFGGGDTSGGSSGGNIVDNTSGGGTSSLLGPGGSDPTYNGGGSSGGSSSGGSSGTATVTGDSSSSSIPTWAYVAGGAVVLIGGIWAISKMGHPKRSNPSRRRGRRRRRR